MIEREISTLSNNGGSTSPGSNGREEVKLRQYRYLAHSPDRNVVKGIIKATSVSDAESALTKAGYQPLVTQQVREALFLRSQFRSKHVKTQDLVTLTEQLAVLLRTGVSLVPSLETMQEQFRNPELRDALEVITEGVRGGMSLSLGMGKYPHIFSNFYIQMIVLGEQSGDLEGILEQTAAYLAREMALRKTVSRAMIYPGVVLAMGAVTVAIMARFVFPKILEMFDVLDVPLPLVTRIVLGTARFINENQMSLMLGFLLLFCGLFLALRRPKTKRCLHRVVLHLPVLKTLVIYRELGRFARVTGLMLHNALPVPSILGMVTGVTSNLEMKRVFQATQAKVTAGDTLSSGLVGESFIPSMFKQLVRVGEISGNLEGNLTSIADFYDRELDSRIDSALGMLEPILTIGIGIIIGVVAITIIVPIYSLIGSAGG